MRRAPRGFTLVEMMVAAVIAFVIVAAGSQLAASMVHAVRKYEEQAELGARAATATAAIKVLLGAVAYHWPVEQTVGTQTTGAVGRAHCATSTGMCPSHVVLPFEICAATTVGAATCTAATAATADAVKAIVPRDGTIEAVVIVDRAGTPLPDDCTIGAGTVTLTVKGATRAAWAVDDIVMVTSRAHITIGRVASVFAGSDDASSERVLALDIGDGAHLVDDDGGAATACSASRSLKSATVMRVKQVIVKYDAVAHAVVVAERFRGSDVATFEVLVADAEDFGARLEIARLPGGPSPSGTPHLCTADRSDVLLGAVLGNGCAGERLNADRDVATVARIIGLQLGMVLRSRVQTQATTEDVVGLFDRTAVIVSDGRLHRRSFVYLGWPE